ncbi:hypothetical protein ACFSL6_18720 [Paenibacillus thailandensis]|uniref:Uncharacterized protein n=1 Tax=Paenibacillus thailandensis TaxID=393250 RepID=A0ABW5QSS5_9BACL
MEGDKPKPQSQNVSASSDQELIRICMLPGCDNPVPSLLSLASIPLLAE